MSDKLSDCPFCGGTNCTATSRGISKWYFIYCPDCLAEGPAENTPDQAIVAWNRRPSPASAIHAAPISDQQILDIAKRVTPAFRESPASCIALVREALKAAPAISESEDAPGPVGDWMWRELMDYCRERGTAPANNDRLFEIVKRAREQFDAARKENQS